MNKSFRKIYEGNKDFYHKEAKMGAKPFCYKYKISASLYYSFFRQKRPKSINELYREDPEAIEAEIKEKGVDKFIEDHSMTYGNFSRIFKIRNYRMDSNTEYNKALLDIAKDFGVPFEEVQYLSVNYALKEIRAGKVKGGKLVVQDTIKCESRGNEEICFY